MTKSLRETFGRMTRRDWLKVGGGAGGVLALAGGIATLKCWGLVESALAASSAMRDHRVASTGDQMVIVHGSSAARNVRAALEALGGMRRFVSPQDRVLIKPNIAWDRIPEQAATTNPEVVAAVVRACRDAGVERPRVLDCPVHDPERCYQRSGILAAARDAGATVLLPAQSPYAQVKLPGHDLKWPIREAFLWADKIINVPVAKHHGSLLLSAGMKNWIGITDKRRELFHTNLQQSIASLAEFVKPTLTIIDATRVLMRNGPTGGNLDDVKLTNALVASLDPVAADVWACELLGFPVERVPHLGLAAARQLGQLDWRKLRHRELQLG